MASLVGKSFNAYLGDMIQVSNNGTGINGSLIAISSWTGTASALLVSTSAVQAANINFNGNTISTSTGALTINSLSGTNNFSTSTAAITTIGNASGTTTINGTTTFGGNVTITGTITFSTQPSFTSPLTIGSYTLGTTANATIGGTNTGDQTITLTGDVTGSGTGSFAATIGSNKVTYAKMQQTAGGSVLLGNTTGSAGAISEQTITAAAKSGLSASQTLLQRVHTNIPVTSGSSTYSPSNTAPTTSNGAIVQTLAITPLSATSRLRVKVSTSLSNSGANHTLIFLTTAASANAVATAIATMGSGGNNIPTILEYDVLSGGTSSITFTLYGVGSAGTWAIGGNSSYSLGGTFAGLFEICEYTA